MSARENDEWTERWLDSVTSGKVTMSQRSLGAVERHGGLSRVRKIARQKGVHLLLVRDDQGRELLAASVNPFKVLC